MSNTLLIDTDVICYQFAFRNTSSYDFDGDGEMTHTMQPELAKAEVRIFIDDLMETLDGDKVYLILSDNAVNFRKELEPTYKENRAGKPKPPLWATIREYIESGDHGFPVREMARLEGDDVLGIMATYPKRGKRSIIVSIDKDMQTVPGRLYLWNKPIDAFKRTWIRRISPFDAARFHLEQVLTGDAVDNYKGCPGIGIVKATAILDSCDTASEMWEAVVGTYESKGLDYEDALLQARLAYILQYGDYKGGKIRLWNPKRLTGVNR